METNNRKQIVIALAATVVLSVGMTLSALASGTEVATKKVDKETSTTVTEQSTSEVVDNVKDKAKQAIDTNADEVIESDTKETEMLDKKDATGVSSDTDKGGS